MRWYLVEAEESASGVLVAAYDLAGDKYRHGVGVTSTAVASDRILLSTSVELDAGDFLVEVSTAEDWAAFHEQFPDATRLEGMG